MLTNVISSFRLKKGKVLKLISWKHSFKRLNEEYEIAKKKKQALDNLFETGRISQATRDSFDNDINAVIMEIEKQQTALLTKMQGKAEELESQVKTLETLLANYEIQHVVGEIDEEFYQREINLLSTGLESAKRELDIIKEATNQLCPPVEETAVEPSLPSEENEAEVAQTESVESALSAPEEVEATEEPGTQEPVITMETAVLDEPVIENPEAMPEETLQAVDASEETTEILDSQQPEITEETPQVTDAPSPEVVCQPQVTEGVPQDMNEAPEVTAEDTDATEDTPQISEDPSLESEYQPQYTEETPQEMAETPETAEDNTDVAEELSQITEEIDNQPTITEETQLTEEEMPHVTDNEPQLIEETLQTMEETPKEPHPSEAHDEAPDEVSTETAVEEAQSDEEQAETAEADDDTEYHEL
jgi:hypothetical protein